MAIVTLPTPLIVSALATAQGGTGATLNAAAEESFLIGPIFWEGGTSGATKVLSTSGRIFWVSASGVTFANVATNLRIGAQDIDGATGLPDGTFDVFADWVPGTETITSSALHNTLMESGSKTFTYGANYAIGMTMTARGGVDQVTQDRVDLAAFAGAQTVTLPYGVHLGAKSPIIPQFLIKFDDGTFGWIYNAQLLWNTNDTAPAVQTFGSGSATDEYAGIFSFATDLQIAGIGASLGAIASGDAFELILYSDPLGTPTVIEAITCDPDLVGVTNNVPYYRLLSTPVTLTGGLKYAIAARPTTAATISFGYLDLTTGFHELKKGQPFTTIQMGGRADQTGAFVETQTYHLPLINVGISGINPSGGGASFFPFGG